MGSRHVEVNGDITDWVSRFPSQGSQSPPNFPNVVSAGGCLLDNLAMLGNSKDEPPTLRQLSENLVSPRILESGGGVQVPL